MKSRRKRFRNEFGSLVSVRVENATPLEGEYTETPPVWIDFSMKPGEYRHVSGTITPFEARGLIEALEPFATKEKI